MQKIFFMIIVFFTLLFNIRTIHAAVVAEVEPNNTSATAQNVDSSTNWTLDFDANIGDMTSNTSTTIPHITIAGSGNNNNDYDFYSFTVSNAGDRAIFDIDNTNGWDSNLVLYDTDGTTELTSNDDALATYGQSGSTANCLGTGDPNSCDAYIEHTFTSPGVYYVKVASTFMTPNDPIPDWAVYDLQISIENYQPPPTEIPTLTQWGMIIFVVFAGLGAVYFIRRQNIAKS